jgi:hypothetical protein
VIVDCQLSIADCTTGKTPLKVRKIRESLEKLVGLGSSPLSKGDLRGVASVESRHPPEVPPRSRGEPVPGAPSIPKV